MRWMNLEPIIQSEMSQKEKGKYRILMHIDGSRKMVLKNLFFRAAMEKQTYRTDLWIWGERRRG